MSNDQHFAHVRFANIVKSYGRRKDFKTILKNINIELNAGQCTLISGENGSGKSTLLRILAGLLKPEFAQVNMGFGDISWKKSRKVIHQHIMYLYQEPYMFDGSVSQNLAYALKNKSPEKINKALQWAGLEQHASTQAKCLSGGQKQRVALAQAWLKQPSILLLDEPTANMDENSRQSTEQLLKTFKETGTALLIASHDIHHFERIMDNRLLLKNGVLTEIDPLESLKINPLDRRNANIALFPKKKA